MKLLEILRNSNLMKGLLESGEEVGFKLIVLSRVDVLLVPFLRPGGGVVFKPDINLWNPKAAVTAKLFQFDLVTLDPE